MMESPVQCECYAHAAPGFFSLAGTAVKASGTDAQPDAAGSVLWGLGSFPNKQKIAFVSRKPCLQKSDTCEKSAFLFTLKARCAIMSIEFFDGLETT